MVCIIVILDALEIDVHDENLYQIIVDDEVDELAEIDMIVLIIADEIDDWVFVDMLDDEVDEPHMGMIIYENDVVDDEIDELLEIDVMLHIIEVDEVEVEALVIQLGVVNDETDIND